MTNPAQPVVTDAMIKAGALAYNGGLKIGLKARLRAAYLAMQAAQPVADSEVVEVLRDVCHHDPLINMLGKHNAAALLAKLDRKGEGA